MNDVCHLLIALLCTWRVTHLLQAEDGPWDVSVRIRRAAGDSFLGQLLDCFYCLSLWIALPVAWALHDSVTDFVLLWPAVSGGSILLQRVSTAMVQRSDTSQAQATEDNAEK